MTEYLLALANDSRLTAQHVSLFVAITANYLAAGGPFDVDRPQLMKQAKIRRKDTYIALVHDLHEFEYIHYEPGHRYKPTRITVIVPTFATDTTLIIPISETDGHRIVPVSATHATVIGRKNETDETTIVPPFEADEVGIIPKNGNDGINPITDNQSLTAISLKSGNDDRAAQPLSSTSKKKSIKENKNDDVADDGSRSAADADRAAKRNSLKSVVRPNIPRQVGINDVLFAETEFYDLACFKAAFADDPKFANVDLEHYHEALKDWRDRDTGQPPRRTNWLGTARTFMRNDRAAGKLVTLSVTNDRPQPTATSTYDPAAIIDRSKYRRDRPGKLGI